MLTASYRQRYPTEWAQIHNDESIDDDNDLNEEDYDSDDERINPDEHEVDLDEDILSWDH